MDPSGDVRPRVAVQGVVVRGGYGTGWSAIFDAAYREACEAART